VRRRRFYIEAALAGLTALLTVVTLISKEWIEIVFGVDPDGGSGALEWAIVGCLALISVGLSVAAWRESVRTAPAFAER
jgi:hypothetical protein